MSLSTFTTSAVGDVLTAAEVPDLLLTKTLGDVTARGIILFDKVDAALIVLGEASRTDLDTTRVTFSAGGKIVLQRFANSDSLTWTDYHPFTRKAQELLDSVLDPLADLSSGSFTPVDPVTATDPDVTTISANIVSKADAETTAALMVARDAIAAAFEEFDPLCSPARVGNSWTFSTLVKDILNIMASSTPTVFPTVIFQSKYDALLAEFNAAITVGIKVSEDLADV